MRRLATFGVALAALTTGANAQGIGPAPAGDAGKVAARIIGEAEHPCPRVSAATRLGDGSIRATCSNGEAYRVGTLRGQEFALRCAAAERMGIKGC